MKMKRQSKHKVRRVIGRVSTDTKGPPGVYMEVTGLWNGQYLTN
jgi:hypothetical protein